MNLDETPQIVNWPPIHYVFVERVGPIQANAPLAWKALHELLPALGERNKITGYMSLYKVPPKNYRAGVSVAAAPQDLPAGLKYTLFEGGKYSRFVLTGPHSDLPAACGRVAQIVAERQIRVRDGFNIENYLNDPRTTAEGELRTEILVAVE